MFDELKEKLKKDPKTIVFTEGPDPRILDAATKLSTEGILSVILIGKEAEVKAAAAEGGYDISACRIIDPENYANFGNMVTTMYELRKGKMLPHIPRNTSEH